MPESSRSWTLKSWKRAQQDEIGRLLEFLARRIHIGDAGRRLARPVEIDAGDFAFGARLEIRFAHQHRQDRGLRTGLGIIGAAEPFAEAAIGALPERDAERIGVGLRKISGRLREWLVAEFLGGLRKQRVAVALLLRRRRIGPRARALERIAAVLDRSLEIAGFARRAAQIFELVVMRLEIVVGDAPILDGHVLRQEIGAVALRQVTAQHEIGRQKAPSLGVPMHAGAADAVAEHERAPVAHRQRRLVGVVAERHRHLRRPQKQLVLEPIAQLVLRVGDRKIGRGVAPRAALDRDDVEARVGQFVGENGAGPAEPDDDDVFAGKLSAPSCRCLDYARSRIERQVHCDQFG